ncbi:lipopolysaccharide biosynthesis protein [Spirulina subsalsa FACHB-351]|uniref:Lipopolysaccharide biosynthesis protein n=1 Tax=Spirulina subsalsa FACHB-351 TaxID=234711 RepID=A0ABT3L8T9_9CYAN|nr:lipopolysaccharide biosynthesis protein [Spirulina subsalsa]MCW6037909.1 lipopolysaccharide biosynthesis protein [Spirulina subsalsa FACHB-351]
MFFLPKPFRDIFSLGLSSVVSRAILFIRESFLAASLGPNSYGIWVQIIVILNYSLHLPLGYQHILSRDVPFYRGRNDNDSASDIIISAFWVTIITAVIASLTLIALIATKRLFSLSLQNAIVLGLVIIAQQYNGFQSITLRAYEKFSYFSIGLTLIGCFSFLGAILFSNKMGASGALIGQGIALVLISFWWFNYLPKNINIRLPIQKVARNIFILWSTAVPLFIGGLANFLVTSLDRLIASLAYSSIDIGYYGFAFALTQSIHLVTIPVAQAFHPRMMRVYGQEKNLSSLLPYLKIFMDFLPITILITLGFIGIAASFAIPLWLPEYEKSIPILNILIIAAAPLAIAGGSQTILVALQKEKLVMWSTVIALGLQSLVYGGCILLDFDIKGLAWAVVISFTLFGLWFAYFSIYSLYQSNRKTLLMMTYLFGVILIYSAFFMLLIEIEWIKKQLFLSFLWKILVWTVLATPIILLWFPKIKFLLGQESANR